MRPSPTKTPGAAAWRWAAWAAATCWTAWWRRSTRSSPRPSRPGREIGLYDDPYSRFGHLQGQAFRAAQLVVDTGIHALGWSRQQAIDFMAAQTGVDRPYVTSEVDRYTSAPGQALAYMIGKLKLDELRDRARARLGERFDLRSFHNAVIDNGALPLDVLDTLIDEWIAGQA